MNLLLGAHRATVGGRHHALYSGAEIGCEAVQIFTSSPRQWKEQPVTDADLTAWEEARRATGIQHLVAHDSYLINLCAGDPAVRERSVTAFAAELRRCDQLDIPYLVTHPGAHVGAGEAAGIAEFATTMRRIYDLAPELRAVTLLETTAGQGTCLGHRFEQLAELIEKIDLPDKVAVCLDTCHVFAAGYDLRDEAGYQATMQSLESTFGAAAVRVLHLNDSKTDLGSRVDRHEQIGEGYLGDRAFQQVITDPRFAGRPMLLETPDLERHADNLERLRRLARDVLHGESR
ncbi:MAG: deoxyribonuclease IV [Armatimonadetes bacterium]|nr:deoxyribonuclease IV [Armatimonadota bacterium]